MFSIALMPHTQPQKIIFLVYKAKFHENLNVSQNTSRDRYEN